MLFISLQLVDYHLFNFIVRHFQPLVGFGLSSKHSPTVRQQPAGYHPVISVFQLCGEVQSHYNPIFDKIPR